MKTHNWFLVIAVVLVGYVLWRGGDDRFSSRRQLNYDTVAISDGLSAKALELDLQRDLDPALLPELGREAIRAAAQKDGAVRLLARTTWTGGHGPRRRATRNHDARRDCASLRNGAGT